MITSSRNCTRFTLLCFWIFPPRQQNLIFDRCRSNYTQLDRELSFFRIDDASLNVTMTHQESPHGHGSYLFLVIVVSRVLDVVDILKLLICPRTKLCPYDSRRHFSISLCVFYSLSCLSGRTHVKTFMSVAPSPYCLHFAL